MWTEEAIAEANKPYGQARISSRQRLCLEGMEIPTINVVNFWLLAGSLLVAVLALLEAGRRIGIHRRKVDPEGASVGLGAIEGAVFGLMGLLIAFTFSGAAARFDGRRQLVGEEANAVATAICASAFYPSPPNRRYAGTFANYVDARLAPLERPTEASIAANSIFGGIAIQWCWRSPAPPIYYDLSLEDLAVTAAK